MALLALKRKMGAFSVIEAIVTMVLILTVFFITAHFFVSVNASGQGIMRIKAGSVLDTYIHSAFARKDFSNKRTMLNDWPVATSTTEYQQGTGMIQVTFIIYKKDGSTPFLSREFLVNMKNSDE
jgi:hypothetical protein